MPPVPAKVATRLSAGLKTFHPILSSAKARDINESDTVTIIKDMLADVFGYDKYAEITSEFQIKSTYVDLAIRIDGKPHLLIEVKAIGATLDERHTKQAVDYAANQGVEWVVLTNGVNWRAYKVTFGKPIGQELVMDVDLLALNPRSSAHAELLFPLTREGFLKSALQAHHEQKQATNRYVLGAILQQDAVLEVVRREVRRLNPDVKLELAEIRNLLTLDVLKRDVVEGDAAKEAQQKVRRAASRRLRIAGPNGGADDTPTQEEGSARAETPPAP